MSHQMTRTSLEQSSSSLPLPASRDSASACSVYLPHTIVCVFFVVSLALTGCQSEAGSSPDLFDGEPWTLSGPELKIGSLDDPEFVFGTVGMAGPGPDGFVYSLHPREATIRRWTADGVPAGTVGRQGEGPGEFTQPGRMGFFGDSLWVMDYGLRRITYFDLEGTLLGSLSPPMNHEEPGGVTLRPSVPLRDGTLIARAGAPTLLIATGELTRNPVTRIDAEGNVLGTIWFQPFRPMDILAILGQDGFGGFFSVQPFQDAPLSANMEDGLLVVDRRSWTGDGPATITVTRLGLAGDTLFASDLPYTPVPLTSERVDSVVRASTERFGRFPEGDIRDATYRPSYLPPVSGVVVGRDGTLWLRHFDPFESTNGERLYEWWVLDVSGAPLVRALIPARMRILTVTSEMVWGVERDELDVDYIVAYRLVKGR